PQPEGAHGLFRARAAIAAELPHRHPFGPADDDHADRHQYVVEPLALILSRSPHELRITARPDAADAVHQLAVWLAVDAALPGLRGSHRIRDQSHREAAET